MPPPIAHTPSDEDLGGPVIVPVILVTLPLSSSGAKMTAKRIRDVADYTVVDLHYYSCSTVRIAGFPLTKKGFSWSTSLKNMVTFHT